MPVYQATSNVKFNQGYIKHLFYKGQPVRTEDKGLISFLSNHKLFVTVSHPFIIKIAPPLHLIKKVKRPIEMDKDEIIAELSHSGVIESPYQLQQTLATKLQTVRKMRPRAWITVLNEKGVPVFIDTIRIEENLPIIGTMDIPLIKYQPPKENDKELQNLQSKIPVIKDSDISDIDDVKLIDENTTRLVHDEGAGFPEGNSGAMERTADDYDIDDNGSYDEFLKKYTNQESNPKVKPEKEVEIVDFVLEEVDKKAEQKQEEETQEEIKKSIDEKLSNINNWRYLVEMSETGKFSDYEIQEDEVDVVKNIKKTKINLMVYNTFLTKHNVWEIEADDHNNKRWNTINKATEILDSMTEEDRTNANIEINMLQRRFNDIEKIEPNYKKSTWKQMKRRLTALSKFGVNINFDENTDMLKYTQNTFHLAKRGLQVPSDQEEIDQLLEKYKGF